MRKLGPSNSSLSQPVQSILRELFAPMADDSCSPRGTRDSAPPIESSDSQTLGVGETPVVLLGPVASSAGDPAFFP